MPPFSRRIITPPYRAVRNCGTTSAQRRPVPTTSGIRGNPARSCNVPHKGRAPATAVDTSRDRKSRRHRVPSEARQMRGRTNARPRCRRHRTRRRAFSRRHGCVTTLRRGTHLGICGYPQILARNPLAKEQPDLRDPTGEYQRTGGRAGKAAIARATGVPT